MTNTQVSKQKGFTSTEYKKDYDELKNCVDIQYKRLVDIFDIFYDHEKTIARINEILTKYKDKKFYLKYDVEIKTWWGPVTNGTKNWMIYDEDTVRNIVPENVNLNKICYSNGKRPYTNIEYPEHYVDGHLTGLWKEKKYRYLEHLGFLHDNLYFIHPKLFGRSVWSDLLDKK